MTTFRRNRGLAWRRPSLMCALTLCLLPSLAEAQAVADVERQLLPLQSTALAPLPESFWRGLTLLREEEDSQRSLAADIAFGLSGDEAGPDSLFKLYTGISLARGVFPAELSVVSRFGLQMRDGRIEENVTSLQITYDYHASHYVQYFTFAERFTDSFLSIQQRYEVGFGTRVGLSFGRVGAWRASDAHFAAVQSGVAEIERLRAASSQARAALEDVQLARFDRAVHNLQHAIEDRQARLFIGVASSVFAELERAELDVRTYATDSSPLDPQRGIASRITLAPEQRYRASIRPTLRFRPTGDVLITVFPYFKLPLDGPRHVEVPGFGRKLDYRRDVLSEMVWTIKSEQTGLESVDVVFTFNHHFDNVPPSLPAQLVEEAGEAGLAFDRTSAEQSHRVIALSLKLKW